ncbi:hypothetical protein [Mesorhizobium sp.]|uniref:hypothetical protein n=1 Tax=Mesorhizobium sp. TaxID=1871066 RepID=UPI000FE465E8|nr:hypothetical protein [Mesorhizobium sp.]RWM39419.1 MAG: hypothetical protein EOR75_14690 [Mesorhizobium sp.]TJV49891.1 MAG: hypothetical protein E5Y01_21955 [Mesorhizobium sp.]
MLEVVGVGQPIDGNRILHEIGEQFQRRAPYDGLGVRPRGNEDPVFDEQLADLQAAVAAAWLAFTPEGDGKAVQSRFGLSLSQSIDALNHSTRLLGAPR